MSSDQSSATRFLKAAEVFSTSRQLPEVPGGWTSQDVVVERQTFRLLLPADPNEFLGDEETLASGPNDDDYVPYWPHLWPASIQMAEAILAGNWQGDTSALELGCGVGLVGLAGLAAGLKVTFSDYEPTAIQLALENAHQNGFENGQAMLLDWKEPPAHQFPLILACEVLYETRHHRSLLALLETMLADRGECWIGDAGRQVAAPFVELARDRGFNVELYDEQGQLLPEPRVGRFQLMKLRTRDSS